MYYVFFAAFAVMSLIAICANFRLKHLNRIPIQWSLSGRVNWSASRKTGLAFIPILFLVTALSIIFTTQSENTASAKHSLLLMAVVMTAIQILHIILVSKKGSD